MIPGRIVPAAGGFVPNPPTNLSSSSQNGYCSVSYTASTYTGKGSSYYYEIENITAGTTSNNGTSTSGSVSGNPGQSLSFRVRVVSNLGVSSSYTTTAGCTVNPCGSPGQIATSCGACGCCGGYNPCCPNYTNVVFPACSGSGSLLNVTYNSCYGYSTSCGGCYCYCGPCG